MESIKTLLDTMKIICVGRNYAGHAREMNAPVPPEPVLFLKPETALLTDNRAFHYPPFSKEIHHELELVVKISRDGKDIDEASASAYYDEIGIGIDFTARDIQAECKEKGLPWEKAKAFDQSAPVGRFIPIERFPDTGNISFSLSINGNTVQKGNSGDMIFSIEKIISHASRYFTLKQGDLIFTGTPDGVGPVKVGDQIDAFIEGEKLLSFEVKKL